MRTKFDLPRPDNWITFEQLCLKVWGHLWEIPHNIDLNSTNEQGQEGVDITGIPKGAKNYYGIQCKSKKLQLKSGKNNSLPRSVIDTEISNAEQFLPPLEHLIIATSLSKDKDIEVYVRELNILRSNMGLFSVQICFWEFIADKIQDNQYLLNWYLNHGDLIGSHKAQVTLDSGNFEDEFYPEFILEIQKHRHIRDDEKQNISLSAREAIKEWDKILKNPAATPFYLRLKHKFLMPFRRDIQPGSVRITINGKPPEEHEPYGLKWDLKLSELDRIDDIQHCDFKIRIKNIGLKVIEDYKLEFEVKVYVMEMLTT